jgi:phosphatidylglycerophosphatase C
MQSPAPQTLAVFDLDGTLTWRDTLVPFLAGYAARNPRKLAGLWRLPPTLFGFVAGSRDRGALKGRLIHLVMGGETRAGADAWARHWVGTMQDRGLFRPAALAALAAHRAAGDRLVLLSASPDLYVPLIGRMLGFERTVCTEVVWDGDRLDGALASENRRGQEKRRCVDELRAHFPGLPIAAYGNSASDLDHLARVERPLLVNANAAARRQAARLAVPCAQWL